MGALISIYAISEYPGGLRRRRLASRLIGPSATASSSTTSRSTCRLPPGHRLYFDFGTATLDAEYEPYQRRVDALMRRAGYAEGVDWMTRKYQGDEHSEKAWRARVDVPLKFLLGR